MDLPTLNRDLWQLLMPEDCMTGFDMVMPEVPSMQRSPAATPYASDRKALKRGEGVLLIVQIQPTPDEMAPGMQGRIQRMWVAVSERCGDYYIGILNTHPSGSYASRDFYLSPGAEIPFLPQHIVDINHPPFGFDIKKVLQTDPRRLWSRDDRGLPSIGDPILSELLQLADQNAIKRLQDSVCRSAFGIGRTIRQTWTDQFITTGILPQDGSEAFIEAVHLLRESARQKTLQASAVCTYRQLQRSSGATADAIVIFLENAAGYSVCWIRTYRQTADGYEFDDLVAQFGEPVVFLTPT